MPQNDFRIFDEAKSNLLSVSDYTSHSQRANGFQANQEAISSVFNTVLYQCSIIVQSIVSFICNKNNVDFLMTNTIQQIQDKISYFFNNFNAKTSNIATDLNLSRFTENSILKNGSDSSLGEIIPNYDKSILFSEEDDFVLKKIVKFSVNETNVSDRNYVTVNTGIAYSELKSYNLELTIISLDSGNKVFNHFKFNLSDLPALTIIITGSGGSTIVNKYNDGFFLKVFYKLYNGNEKYFYLGLSDSPSSVTPSKGQYLTFGVDLTEQEFSNMKYKLEIKEVI